MVLAKQWVMKNQPVPGTPFNMDMNDPNATFELKEVELNEGQLKEGEFLVETLLLSNDPAQKFWIATADKNYAAGISPGELVPARGIGKVIASKNPAYEAGDYVSANVNWTTYIILNEGGKFPVRKVSKDEVGDLSWHLSALGGTALTAYFIFYNYAQLQEREEDYGKVYLISGAAGAVGSYCIQFALHVFKASKIIAIAGGPEKVKYVESFGDKVVGVDYKDPSFKENLIKAAGGPNTVDYFIDNVGGEILDLGTYLLKQKAMLLACGSISGYNDTSKFVFKNYVSVITKRLTIKGLLLTDNLTDFPKGLKKLIEMIKAGYIDVSKTETIVDGTGENFKEVPNLWNGLFKGINKGKLITKVNEY
ncbi:hypothetical protein Kpol_1023p1 [Vanderwaltozyma polyspora DSM 70294]|uniref:Enoyl reductase (ER) domain-containing protein n=1 Tax=Vanderwaltozyma polyspora (strain ATCC 22028 / DSM 70294 / BCRC 21397 / CBS 2163 / NBRC 10782 / NRRL Y-8283 / UCD 57-17) TaxID=436907 RepID=A7TFM4_VANPO|nr:uncharacterized protein Kpol_1023p1 [Vanderwaltozyma polyspora DSM 70294]EDO18832.1 hypothetical protein Kpol_1023p1 [Vanderwaltozyma polyspora DSM 70294]